MSSLQLGLAIAGALLIVAVLLNGWWTARRRQPRQADPHSRFEPHAPLNSLSPQAERPGAPKAPSIVPATQRKQQAKAFEPVIDLPMPVVEEAPAEEPPQGLAPAPQPAPKPVPQAAPPSPSISLPVESEASWPQVERRRQNSRLDASIDVQAVIEFELPASGEAVLHNLPATRRVGSKPFTVEAQSDDGRWETPQPGHQYRAIRTGVQLANRAGMLNELEYSEFIQKTQALADTLGGLPEFPDMSQAIARARELDAFAQAHDAQLSVTLRASRTAWSAGYVQQMAARQGFVAGVLPGRMARQGALHGALTLNYDSQAAASADPTMTAIRDITLNLDAPLAPRAEHPYDQMRAIAVSLAEQMDARITDDAGRPLGEEDLARIGAELQVLYDALEAQGLPAGSMPARRLFS